MALTDIGYIRSDRFYSLKFWQLWLIVNIESILPTIGQAANNEPVWI
jgi:hypothetical protein